MQTKNISTFLACIVVTASICSAYCTNDISNIARIMSMTVDHYPYKVNYMGLLREYADKNNISDHDMRAILRYVAAPDNEYASERYEGTWLRTLSVLTELNDERAIPLFDQYASRNGSTMSLISLFGQLVRYDERLYEYVVKSYQINPVQLSYIKAATMFILQSEKGNKSFNSLTKLKLSLFLLSHPDENLCQAFGNDYDLCMSISGYSNSIDRASAIENMHTLPDLSQFVTKYERNFKDYTKDEALTMMSNELARLKALPPGELIDLSARLDAELAVLTNSAQTVGTATERAPIAGNDDKPAAYAERRSGYGWIAVGAGVVAAAIIGWIALQRRS